MKLSIFLYSSLFVILFGCQSRLSRLTQLPLIANPHNVLIDSNNQVGSFHPCEPSIFVSPSNPSQIVAGAVLNRIYHSHDQGKTWSMQLVSSTYGVYGDPVISADNVGNFYYAHLADPLGEGRGAESWLDRIVVQRSADGGITWSNGSFAGHRPPADQDKHWIAVDPKSQTLYMTWTEFDKYGSTDPEDHSRILFARSLDQGEHWTEAISISNLEGNCLDDDETTEGAVPAVGPKGQVYVSWAYNEQIYFDRSKDGGTNWLEDDIVASGQPGGWSFDIPGLGRANGMPVTAVDVSKSKYRGRVYINYCDQASGSDDTDVRLIYSDDEGNTWSDPIRVNNDDPGKHQFFTWMSLDPITGAIYIIFYDRRAHADNHTDVYLAYSLDGGQHFTNVEISTSSFLPNTSMFFGDYNNISAYNGIVRPIWTRMESDKTSIWTALIDMQ